MSNATSNTTPSDDISRRQNPKWVRLRLLLKMPLPLTAAIILILLLIAALFVAPYLFEQANRQNLRLRFYPPFQTEQGWLFWLGGDALGRSMVAELIYGARTSFLVAGSAVGVAASLGFAIGLVSGYFGGWFDAIIMRLADIIVTLPSLLMALAILFVLGPSVFNLICVLAVARLPVFMRTARAQTLSIREWTFVEVSRSIGASPARIIWRDIRPLVAPTILTVAMLELGNTMLAVAGLSFLGVGLQRPDIDWGTMVAEGRQYMNVAWWITVFPGIAILITALSANILSNWMRAVGDPKQSGALVAKVTGGGN
ncbi:MAG: ABC transporter permease [Rhodobacteraceae bacterium]|nr:ABC transporter permease [Paracoccaceae bacterium]PHR54981.1 MAG: ABC transporter permease [Robiginitomaculum sp.]